MAIEIVDLPIKNGGSFHSFLYVYQRVMGTSWNINENQRLFGAVFHSYVRIPEDAWQSIPGMIHG